MLVLQLYMFGSACNRLPSLGADTEDIHQLRQKSLSGVGKAERDFFLVAVVEKTVIPHLATSNPASRLQFETLIPFKRFFCPFPHSGILLNIMSPHTHTHTSTHPCTLLFNENLRSGCQSRGVWMERTRR